MPPRRIGARGGNIVYKSGDYVEYQYKGSTVTGKLKKKLTNGHGVKPVWLVKPSDKRRKDEDIAEAMLGNIITAEEATFNRAPKLKPSSKNGGSSGTDGGGRGSSPSSSNSHGSSPTNLSDDSNSNAGNRGKRKHDEFDGKNNSGSDRANKEQRKTVTFSQEEVSKSTTSGSKKSKTMKDDKEDSSKAVSEVRRVGTRSSGDAEILPELPSKRKISIKREKKMKKDDNVTIVKMLTGTLYMYRGDRPRAEFVRFK